MAFGDLLGTFSFGATSVGTTTNNLSGSATVAVGDLIVVLCFQNSGGTGTFSTPSDSLGNTYVLDQTGGGTNLAFYRASVTVSGSPTISVFTTSTSNDTAFAAAAFAGPFAASPLDKQLAFGSDTTSPFTSGSSGTFAQADELVIGALALVRCQNVSATSPNLLAVNAQSTTPNTTGSAGSTIGYQVISSTASKTVAFTASGTITTGLISLLSYKKDTSSGVTYFPMVVGDGLIVPVQHRVQSF